MSKAFDQRLRLLMARDYAARGYYLEAEGMFANVSMDSLAVDELELLAKAAALNSDWRVAERRFTLLATNCEGTKAETFRRSATECAEQQTRLPYRLRLLLAGHQGLSAILLGAMIAILAMAGLLCFRGCVNGP